MKQNQLKTFKVFYYEEIHEEGRREALMSYKKCIISQLKKFSIVVNYMSLLFEEDLIRMDTVFAYTGGTVVMVSSKAERPHKYQRYNIVTCGMCGEKLAHLYGLESIICPYCEKEGEPCDYPDLYYADLFNLLDSYRNNNASSLLRDHGIESK